MYAGTFGVAHLALLYFKWYRCIKPVVVAAVFSWVMVAGLPVISIVIYGFIFALTLLNLCVLHALKTKLPWLRWACLLCWLMGVGLAAAALYWWLVIIFALGPLLYVPLVFIPIDWCTGMSWGNLFICYHFWSPLYKNS